MESSSYFEMSIKEATNEGKFLRKTQKTLSLGENRLCETRLVRGEESKIELQRTILWKDVE